MFIRPAVAALAAGLGSLLLPPVGCAAPVTVEIDLAHPGHAISPIFYGLMTEEINYSYDGGLYAELIRNRTFQDPVPGRERSDLAGIMPAHWSVTGDAQAATNDLDPVNPALPLNLRLTLSGGTGGLANNGYWGVPVRPRTKYTATFYARARDGFTGAVTASLVTDADDRTVARATSKRLGPEWRKYTLVFTTPRNAPTTADAHFVLSATGTGSIDFSYVSLFPPTYKDVPNGLRPDLMELLAGLRPAFIRLPGGNYLEGSTFADRFDWKKMIGPPDQRPGHMAPWSYRSSDGFGLPEFLLWCQQLDAEPVLGVFAGYTLNGDYKPAGSPEMDLFTQEALEQIDYVSGPATSEWGRRRAADGFRKPFPLHFVEIGNEDFFDRSGSYEGRFAQMATAIREKYPDIQVIASMPVKNSRPDVIDDHLYASAQSMIRQYDRYDVGSDHADGRKPDGVKVFMGEWATQGGSPTPNHRSALGDAVFVMGLERNSDDVIMQAYAPLLTRVNLEDRDAGHPRGWQWNTNLIGYDTLGAFGSPSYHVLAMFGQNKGDVLLPTTLDVPAVAQPLDPRPHGATGVGTYETGVEYTDMVVTGPAGETLAGPNLVADGARWKFPRGRWTVENGVLRSGPRQSWALAGDPGWTNYTVTLRARKTGGAEGFLLLFQARDGDNYRWLNLGGWGNTVARFEVAEDGGREPYGPSVPFKVETGRWYDLRLEVQGQTARGYVDGKLVIEATAQPRKPTATAFASASYIKGSHEVVVKVVNTSADPLEAVLNIEGARRLGAGQATVLAGDPAAVNSIEHPNQVAPRKERLAATGPQFTRTFEPHSVTLLRFPVKQ